jgi:hypothetical protein
MQRNGQQNGQFHLLRLAAVLSFALALVNHLLPPKAFAATQLLFDYQFGLTRRGLAGEILNLFTGAQIGVSGIYAAAALISALGGIAFYLFLSRLMPQKLSSYLILILALNSFAFSSFIGNTGYLDGLLLALTALALSTNAARSSGLVIRLGVTVLGVMFHENMLPYFTVLIAFDLWLARKGSAAALPIALSPVLLGFVTVAALAKIGAFTPEQAAVFADYIQSKAAFTLDANSTDVAGRSIGQNFALMADLRGTTKYWAWVLFDGVPLLAMALWLIWLANRLLGDSDAKTRLLMIGAIIGPLSLNIIAFDVVRFGVASVLAGFLVLVLLIRHIPKAADRLEQVLTWPHFLVVLVLNVNIFTIEVNIGAGHTSQFPWVLLTQLKWLAP